MEGLEGLLEDGYWNRLGDERDGWDALEASATAADLDAVEQCEVEDFQLRLDLLIGARRRFLDHLARVLKPASKRVGTSSAAEGNAVALSSAGARMHRARVDLSPDLAVMVRSELSILFEDGKQDLRFLASA